jgi:predicted MFS family arabinose efflux permease
MSKGFPPLATAAGSAHLADQMALAGLPLILTAAGASPGVISAVVAAQATAWLVVSLPAGALADRLPRRSIMLWGAWLILVGAGIGWFGITRGGTSPLILGLSGFLISAGVVLQVLSVFALLPRLTSGHGIAKANATLEFSRACAAIAAPITAAYFVTSDMAYAAFAVAVLGGVVSLLAALSLPKEAPSTAPRLSLAQSIRDGARFVWQQPILRAIGLCAIAWNSAFFALTAVLAPYATTMAGLSVGEVGQAWASYGAGLLIGAAVAPFALRAWPTGFLFVLGPIASVCGAAVIVLFAPTYGFWAVALGMFSLGFAPMLWLVLQTSVRQILTPPDMLGRVAATITTTIYGIRPVGALAAGALATAFGTPAALWLSVGLFAVSVLAILLSPAPSLAAMPTATAETV